MLIIDMPMPKHGCCDCMVELMGLCAIQDKYVPLKNENGDYPTELPKGCPIKGVLPDEHGDLIDRDELRKMNVFSQEFNRYVVPMMYIEDANPIVAAERKDERRTR